MCQDYCRRYHHLYEGFHLHALGNSRESEGKGRGKEDKEEKDRTEEDKGGQKRAKDDKREKSKEKERRAVCWGPDELSTYHNNPTLCKTD